MSSINFVTLNDFPEYEIQREYPFRIRRIGKTKCITIGKFLNGYLRVTLNCKNYSLHRVIAKQFIPNPKNKTCVDHINRDRSDYHLTNLRWVSASENNFNKSSYGDVEYEFLEYEEVDFDNVLPVDYYGKHEIYDVWYQIDQNRFLFDNGLRFRVLNESYDKYGSAYVNAKSTDDKYVQIFFTKFKRENNIYH